MRRVKGFEACGGGVFRGEWKKIFSANGGKWTCVWGVSGCWISGAAKGGGM